MLSVAAVHVTLTLLPPLTVAPTPVGTLGATVSDPGGGGGLAASGAVQGACGPGVTRLNSKMVSSVAASGSRPSQMTRDWSAVESRARSRSCWSSPLYVAVHAVPAGLLAET